jgi:hypothetical protein
MKVAWDVYLGSISVCFEHRVWYSGSPPCPTRRDYQGLGIFIAATLISFLESMMQLLRTAFTSTLYYAEGTRARDGSMHYDGVRCDSASEASW